MSQRTNSPLSIRGQELLKGTFRGAQAGVGGATCRTAQSALTVILKLVMLWSDQCYLVVLSAVHLQFQGQFVPVSLRPVLGIVQDGAAYVMATVWSSCS